MMVMFVGGPKHGERVDVADADAMRGFFVPVQTEPLEWFGDDAMLSSLSFQHKRYDLEKFGVADAGVIPLMIYEDLQGPDHRREKTFATLPLLFKGEALALFV